MQIIGCDFHPGHQQVAIVDTSSGEVREQKLSHSDGEVERFYRELAAPAQVGMGAVGNSLWFEQLLEQLGHELWIRNAARIRTSEVRRQKTDKRDANHSLELLGEGCFPRIWTPSSQQRDQQQLLLHRHKLVGMRVPVKNELQDLALQKKRSLWSAAGRKELENLPLEGWTRRRRADLLRLLQMLDEQVEALDQAVAAARVGTHSTAADEPAGSGPLPPSALTQPSCL